MFKIGMMLSGDEQRFSAVQCGAQVISNYNVSDIFFGMDFAKFKNYTTECLTDARLIESDIIDLFIRFGLVPLIVYLIYLVRIANKNKILFLVCVYGLAFGHVAFNPLMLIPIALTSVYREKFYAIK